MWIDGLDPALADYPYLKELSFIVNGAPDELAARFLEFARGPEALAIAVAAGYRPRARDGRRVGNDPGERRMPR